MVMLLIFASYGYVVNPDQGALTDISAPGKKPAQKGNFVDPKEVGDNTVLTKITINRPVSSNAYSPTSGFHPTMKRDGS